MSDPLTPLINEAVERALPDLIHAARAELLSAVQTGQTQVRDFSQRLPATWSAKLDQLRTVLTDNRVLQLDGIPALLARLSGRWQLFTESGIWTCPAPGTPVSVICIGGGSGGVGTSSASTIQPGGDSSFGSLMNAAGGIGRTNATSNTSLVPISPGYFGFGDGGIGAGFLWGRPGEIKFGEFNVSGDQVIIVGAGSASSPPGNIGGKAGAVFVFWWE